MKRQRSSSNSVISAEIESDLRPCAHSGCANPGTHRAPRSRTALTEYLWFCLDHVRAYNAAWNFCAGMSEADIERRVRRDTIWERPSWMFGTAGAHARGPARFTGRVRLNDGFGTIFGEDGDGAAGQQFKGNGFNGHGFNGQGTNGTRAAGEFARAMEVLGLEPPLTKKALKTRYKELAKQLHPDANGGDRTAEDKLKDINLAYATLRKSDLIE